MSTRLYAAGVLAAAVCATNLGAFAATKAEKSAVTCAMCARKEGVLVPIVKGVKPSKPVASVKSVSHDTVRASKVISTKLTAPTAKLSAPSKPKSG